MIRSGLIGNNAGHSSSFLVLTEPAYLARCSKDKPNEDAKGNRQPSEKERNALPLNDLELVLKPSSAQTAIEQLKTYCSQTSGILLRMQPNPIHAETSNDVHACI